MEFIARVTSHIPDKGQDMVHYYGISPQTFYRWKNRYDPYDLRTLESGFTGHIRPVSLRRQ